MLWFLKGEPWFIKVAFGFLGILGAIALINLVWFLVGVL
jgi:hypothetical protein